MFRMGTRFQPLVEAVLAHAPEGSWAQFRGITRGGHPRIRWYVRAKDGTWSVDDPRPLDTPTIFFCLNPRSRPDGTAKGVLGVGSLFVDIDREVTARAIDHLAAVGLLPSAIVDSGHGRHAYFFLDQLAVVAASEPIARRLVAFCGGDAVFSSAQCARLPHSLNVKEHPSRPVTLLELHPLRRWSLLQIDAALDHAGAPPLEVFAAAATKARNEPSTRLDPTRANPARAAELIARLDNEAQGLVLAGVHPGDRFRGDRSLGDASLVRKLLDIGATDDEVAMIFQSHPTGCGRKTLEAGSGYLDLTLRSIRDLMHRAFMTSELVQVITAKADRLELCLTTGSKAGASWWQPIARNSGVTGHVFRAFDLVPGPRGLLETCGRFAYVALNEYQGRPNVTSWLPC
jgi:hypothetical protein